MPVGWIWKSINFFVPITLTALMWFGKGRWRWENRSRERKRRNFVLASFSLDQVDQSEEEIIAIGYVIREMNGRESIGHKDVVREFHDQIKRRSIEKNWWNILFLKFLIGLVKRASNNIWMWCSRSFRVRIDIFKE